MTNFKKYFRYHLKSNIKTLIYILVPVIILTLLIGINSQPQYTYWYGEPQYYHDEPQIYYNSTINIPVIFMCILAYVLPVTEFSFFKKRINLDCAYSLPISRKGMGVVHYLTGLITLVGAFTASYLTNFILLLSRGPGHFNFAPMIEHYAFCLMLGCAIYSIMVFVFNEANTRGDGIWFMILYTFVVLLIVSTVREVFGKYLYLDTSRLLPWGLFERINTGYANLIEIRSRNKTILWEQKGYLYWFIFWIEMGIASAFAFFLTFGNRRMEKTEEISDSYFGFRTLIPIYAISCMLLLNSTGNLIVWFILEIITLIAYTIYRRGFHYKKGDVATMIVLWVLLILQSI